MSDLKRLLERSLREKEPDDFENIHAKVEEFIRDNKVDDNAGKQLRAADPRIQKEVIHRGGLLECKNPSAVCLARIREERKLLGDALDAKQVTMARKAHESIRDGIVNQVDMSGAAAQVQAQQLQAQQRLMMAQQMALLQGGMGGIAGMNAIGVPNAGGALGVLSTTGCLGALGGVGSLGGVSALPSLPGLSGVAGGGVAGLGGVLGMGMGMGAVGTAGGGLAGISGMPANLSALSTMSMPMGSTMVPQITVQGTQPTVAPHQVSPAMQPASADAIFQNPSPSTGIQGMGCARTQASIPVGGVTAAIDPSVANLLLAAETNLGTLVQSVPSTGMINSAISSTAAACNGMTSPAVVSSAMTGPVATSPGVASTAVTSPGVTSPGVAVAGASNLLQAVDTQGQAAVYGAISSHAMQRASPY